MGLATVQINAIDGISGDLQHFNPFWRIAGVLHCMTKPSFDNLWNVYEPIPDFSDVFESFRVILTPHHLRPWNELAGRNIKYCLAGNEFIIVPPWPSYCWHYLLHVRVGWLLLFHFAVVTCTCRNITVLTMPMSLSDCPKCSNPQSTPKLYHILVTKNERKHWLYAAILTLGFRI